MLMTSLLQPLHLLQFLLSCVILRMIFLLIKHLGPLHYFLGIDVQHLFDGFRLSRQSILLIYYNGLLWSLQACPHTIVLQQQVHSS
jgi:hypothetical protein